MLSVSDEDITEIEREIGNLVSFDSVRKDILKDNSSFDVQACPGSGKTTLLAAKLLILSKKWKSKNKGVCVLSHTKVAKNEIVKRLENHPTGWTFLKYPHFVGTIQEFVNRFLAIPYIRDQGWPITFIDNDIYNKKGWTSLSYGTKKYLENNHVENLYGLSLEFQDDKLKLKVPVFQKESQSDSYQNLLKVKNALVTEGYFQYKEMYEFAKDNIYKNPIISNLLQNRFSFLFLDEMQDTQKHQDELLQTIFPLNGKYTLVQRFGDEDQAIFDRIGQEDPNESFVSTKCKYRIDNTHRFSPCICNLARGMSSSKINLVSKFPCLNNGNHIACANYGKNVIYSYKTDDEAKKVIEIFSTHVKNKIKCTDKTIIKVVGAIGKATEHVNINSYAPYKKETKKDTFQPLMHYESVAFAYHLRTNNVTDNYDLIVNSIVHFIINRKYYLKVSNAEKQRVSKATLIETLKEYKLLSRVNVLIGKWLFSEHLPTKEEWLDSITKLDVILNLCCNTSINCSSDAFYSFPSDSILSEYSNASYFNSAKKIDTINIELNTIHGIKGETHNATLVLETYYLKYYDIDKLIPFTYDSSAVFKKGNKTLPRFMKQLYVAMTRPTEILCLAVKEERIASHKTELEKLGWVIKGVSD